jgi:hypothetical protein
MMAEYISCASFTCLLKKHLKAASWILYWDIEQTNVMRGNKHGKSTANIQYSARGMLLS